MIDFNINEITLLLSSKIFYDKYSKNHKTTKGKLYTCYFCKYIYLKINDIKTHNYKYHIDEMLDNNICDDCIKKIEEEMTKDINKKKYKIDKFDKNEEKYLDYSFSLDRNIRRFKYINNYFKSIIKTNKLVSYDKDELSKLICKKEYSIGKNSPKLYETCTIKEGSWCNLEKPCIKNLTNVNETNENIDILNSSICYNCKKNNRNSFICLDCSIIVNKFQSINCPNKSIYTENNKIYSICKPCFSIKNFYDINIKKDIEKKKKYILIK